MTEKSKILLDEARKLSLDERIELAEQIMSSIDEIDPEIESAWSAEVADRIAAHERGDTTPRPAAEVMAKYR